MKSVQGLIIKTGTNSLPFSPKSSKQHKVQNLSDTTEFEQVNADLVITWQIHVESRRQTPNIPILRWHCLICRLWARVLIHADEWVQSARRNGVVEIFTLNLSWDFLLCLARLIREFRLFNPGVYKKVIDT